LRSTLKKVSRFGNKRRYQNKAEANGKKKTKRVWRGSDFSRRKKEKQLRKGAVKGRAQSNLFFGGNPVI